MRAALVLAALAACKGGTRAAPRVDAGLDAAALHGPAMVDATAPSHVAWLLDAFEREPDAVARGDLSIAIGREDAVVAGVADRVIALVRAYVALPGGDWTASGLMLSLVKGEAPPPPAVGDLVFEVLDHGGPHTRFVAFYVVAKMTDRLDEVCAAMAKLAATDALPQALTVIAGARAACAAQLDAVVDAIVAAAADDAFEVQHFLAIRALAEQTPLSPAQLGRLARAARQARKDAERHEKPFADQLVRQLDDLR